MIVRPKLYTVTVDVAMLRGKDLSFSAKGLYAYLLGFADTTNLNAKSISMDVREHEESIQKDLNLLETYGYITQ